MNAAYTLILGYLQSVINVRHEYEVHKGINSKPQLIPLFLLDFLRFTQIFQKRKKNRRKKAYGKYYVKDYWIILKC